MRILYYDAARKLYRHKWRLRVAAMVAFLAVIPLFIFVDSTEKAGLRLFGSLLGLLVALATAAVFVLSHCISTFHRLDEERGVYRNHRRQEVVYSIMYTFAFCFLLLAGILGSWEYIRAYAAT